MGIKTVATRRNSSPTWKWESNSEKKPEQNAKFELKSELKSQTAREKGSHDFKYLFFDYKK